MDSARAAAAPCRLSCPCCCICTTYRTSIVTLAFTIAVLAPRDERRRTHARSFWQAYSGSGVVCRLDHADAVRSAVCHTCCVC
ncbi:hypothetical protein POSPLADRAFT_1039445 [Postia placenta MAD-698-R-SB12]|uniref:Uncharacterized protein n=1 Tax=Postia placenta MAD-698-R-SB12 TaxID=670580 RepID=A0A1X6N7W8_9APHY|nr:hypothetical protein POSPLADRAFT_1039445 [Postia placenta MAD-698-R-SB12]OSX64566.1 hypothetical protein POSPLADRAFT_1039445 [Postia placenta MAD-698-R-SB12]